MIRLKTDEDLQYIRASARVNQDIHRIVASCLKPGVLTKDLAEAARAELSRAGAQSSFVDAGFPDVICVSVNEQIGHGVPGGRKIQDGDVVKIDVGVCLEGFHSDCAVTHVAGSPSIEAKRLIEATESALRAGIRAVVVNQPTSNISYAVSEIVTRAGFRVVRHAFGHGLGRELHEDPQIASFGPPGYGPRLRSGMVLAIEPVVVSGCGKTCIAEDGWTTFTKDGGLAAHAEHTIWLGNSGVDILTANMVNSDLWGEVPTPGLTWRKKIEADNSKLVNLAKQEMDKVLLAAWGRPVQPAEILSVPNTVTFVLMDDHDDLQGFCIYAVEADSIYVTTLVLDQRLHGTGLSSWIFEGLLRFARQEGKSAIELCVQNNNHRAIRFYLKKGFRVVGQPMPNTFAMRRILS